MILIKQCLSNMIVESESPGKFVKEGRKEGRKAGTKGEIKSNSNLSDHFSVHPAKICEAGAQRWALSASPSGRRTFFCRERLPLVLPGLACACTPSELHVHPAPGCFSTVDSSLKPPRHASGHQTLVLPFSIKFHASFCACNTSQASFLSFFPKFD